MAPNRCTGITQRTLGVRLRSTISAVIRWESGSTSTSRGVAPTALTASAVAMKEFDGTITSSPGPISSARSASASASVPEETPTANSRLAVVGELLLEALDGLPEGERAALGHAPDQREQLLEQGRVGEVQAGEWNRGGARFLSCGIAVQHVFSEPAVEGAQPS